jgi:CRISPR-associated protein Cmr2
MNWLSKQQKLYKELPNENTQLSTHPISGEWQVSPYLKNQYWWGGGASREAWQQVLDQATREELTQVGIISFGPVQAFLGGGQRLRDWAVASWLCHYLSAVMIRRWQERGGRVLLPLHQTTSLVQWLNGQQTDGKSFWQAELPNVIVGLHPEKDGWIKRLAEELTDEWGLLLRHLEKAAVKHSPSFLNGVGWRVIHRDNKHFWSVYAETDALQENASETIAALYKRLESQKTGRKWEGPWWGGRTSPSAGNLSAWNPGLKPFDEGGTWGLPDEQVDNWWKRVAKERESSLSGLFSSDERLNSIEMVKRLASVSEIITPALKTLWQKELPSECPWERFPDRTASAAVWVPKQLDSESWNRILQPLQSLFFEENSRPWGMPSIDKSTGEQPYYTHPRVLERRNIRELDDVSEFEGDLSKDWQKETSKLQKGWESAIEWTVGWRGDGDYMGKWLSGQQYKERNLPWAKWHPTQKMYEQYQLSGSPCSATGAREIELPHMLDLSILFSHWNELLYPLVEKYHQGKVIFAGGDDFLLLGPLTEAVSLSTDLYHLWTGKPSSLTQPLNPSVEGWVQRNEEIYPVPSKTMSFSLGVVIAQRRIPQSLWHRGLNQAYKRAKNAGRNRVCVQVIFNSGQTLEWVCPWPLWELLTTVEAEGEKTDLNRWEKLLAYVEGTRLQSRHPHEVKEMLDTLWASVGFPLTWAQMKGLESLTTENYENELENWEWWLQWIGLRAFLARQERERSAWLERVQPGGRS